MKVRELMERLEQEDPDAEVHFAYNYGDHWHSMVAPKVRRVEDGMIRHSDYHRMDKLIDTDEEFGHKEGDREVVILRS